MDGTGKFTITSEAWGISSRLGDRPTEAAQQGTKQEEGTKYDAGKPRMELLSVDAMRAIAEVMTYGAKKYADHNWRKGLKWSRVYGSALRHLTDHMNGISIDPESGLSNLAHLGACVDILLEYEKRGLGTDDRYWVSK